jgi:hypothetical protein
VRGPGSVVNCAAGGRITRCRWRGEHILQTCSHCRGRHQGRHDLQLQGSKSKCKLQLKSAARSSYRPLRPLRPVQHRASPAARILLPPAASGVSPPSRRGRDALAKAARSGGLLAPAAAARQLATYSDVAGTSPAQQRRAPAQQPCCRAHRRASAAARLPRTSRAPASTGTCPAMRGSRPVCRRWPRAARRRRLPAATGVSPLPIRPRAGASTSGARPSARRGPAVASRDAVEHSSNVDLYAFRQRLTSRLVDLEMREADLRSFANGAQRGEQPAIARRCAPRGRCRAPLPRAFRPPTTPPPSAAPQ